MGYSARYHAISLIAVFLALAIGILIGAEFGGDALNSTRKNLEHSLIGNLQDARSRADQLSGELGGQTNSLSASTRSWSVTGWRASGSESSPWAAFLASVSSAIETALGPTGARSGRGRGGARAGRSAALAGDLSKTRFANIDHNSETAHPSASA